MMNFAISIERHGSATLLELVGEFDMDAAPMFARVVGDQLSLGDRCLVFDLDRLEYIDSRGICAMIEMLRSIYNHRGCASIVLGNARVARIFELSGIANAFRFFPDRASALAVTLEWRVAARPSNAMNVSENRGGGRRGSTIDILSM